MSVESTDKNNLDEQDQKKYADFVTQAVNFGVEEMVKGQKGSKSGRTGVNILDFVVDLNEKKFGEKGCPVHLADTKAKYKAIQRKIQETRDRKNKENDKVENSEKYEDSDKNRLDQEEK